MLEPGSMAGAKRVVRARLEAEAGSRPDANPRSAIVVRPGGRLAAPAAVLLAPAAVLLAPAAVLLAPAAVLLAPAAVLLASAAAHAAPAPAVIAKCGDSAIDVTPGPDGGTATLHG